MAASGWYELLAMMAFLAFDTLFMILETALLVLS
jgi:hypothetical protein